MIGLSSVILGAALFLGGHDTSGTAPFTLFGLTAFFFGFAALLFRLAAGAGFADSNARYKADNGE